MGSLDFFKTTQCNSCGAEIAAESGTVSRFITTREFFPLQQTNDDSAAQLSIIKSTLLSAMLYLNDGNDMPQVGVSAFRTDIIETTKEIITNKVDIGVRHFEIAELFGNGHTVVESYFSHPRVQNGEFERKDMFLTLKIWPKDRKPAELIAACRETLDFAGLTYADLVLVHAPIEIGNRFEQWKTLEEMVSLGLTKSLGVANITGLQLADLLKNSNIPPAVFEVSKTGFI